MKNVIQPLAKSVLITLELTAAASAADVGMHEKILRSGTTTLIISNDEVEDIIKIIQALENSGLSLKGVSETIQDEAKEKKGGFLSMLLGTLVHVYVRCMLVDEGVIRAGYGSKRKGIVRTGYGSKGSSIKKRF